MTKFKEDIESVIANEAILQIKLNNTTNCHGLELIETGQKATLRYLKVTHIKESDTCITFDVSSHNKFATYSPYLKSTDEHSFNKRCDFIIARKDGGIWRVYFGDLKSEKVKVGNILKQLAASQLFFDYILTIIKSEFNNNELLERNGYASKYICVHDNAVNSSSGTMRSTTSPRNEEPYIKTCQITKKELIIMPVGVLSQGRAKVSFNKFLGKITKRK